MEPHPDILEKPVDGVPCFWIENIFLKLYHLSGHLTTIFVHFLLKKGSAKCKIHLVGIQQFTHSPIVVLFPFPVEDKGLDVAFRKVIADFETVIIQVFR